MMDTVVAAHAVGGRMIGEPALFARVTTDSRSITRGDLFVALKGERFDGHDYVEQALAAGASAALVATSRAASIAGNLIAVPDPLHALGVLARHWRRQFELPLVVVTGSNGKTTTKEMIAAMFRAEVGASHVLATAGNLNNAIGLPLTVLGLRSDHKLAVLEAGMNHRHETRELAAIACPTIAVVTNAQREHQEFMASVAEVADEHADAIAALPPGGVAVINADDAYADVWRKAAREARASICDFGLDRRAAVTARFTLNPDSSAIELRTPGGDVEVTLRAPGRHMVVNALAATAAALSANVSLSSIARGLGEFLPLAGRLAIRAGIGGVRVIDDTYNANPDSVRAAIDVLASAPGTRWLVLGDMGEVGAQGPAFHREMGEYARSAGIDRLLAVGSSMANAVEAFGRNGEHLADVDAVSQRIVEAAGRGDTVLVKGSRFMRMERVVAALVGTSTGGSH